MKEIREKLCRAFGVMPMYGTDKIELLTSQMAFDLLSKEKRR